MAANGFLEQRPRSPLSFGAVLLLHGGLIAAVVMLKGPDFVREKIEPLKTINIEIDEPPPPTPLPQPDQPQPSPPTITRYDLPPPLVPPLRPTTSAEAAPPVTTFEIGKAVTPTQVPFTRSEPERIVEIPPVRPRPIVRVEAQFDPRFADALQPPYPAVEQRAEREGTVQVRVRISPAGRVIAAERISATSDAFWRATERQALSRWRFKPATVDGEPVESSKVLSLRFQLDGR